MRRVLSWLSVALVVPLLAVACGTTGEQRAANTTSPPIAGPTAYPLVIRNCGQEYTFTEAPRRVAILNGGSEAEVSSMLALGLGDRIVASAQTLRHSDGPGWAEAAAALPTGGIARDGMQDLQREALLALKPDLVLGVYAGHFDASGGYATREELRAAGANTYVNESTCRPAGMVAGNQTMADSDTLLRDLGRIFDVADRAETHVRDTQRRIDAVAEKVRNRPRKKVMFIIPGMNMGSGDFSSIGANGIWNDIFEKAGGENAFAGVTDELFANLSREKVAATPVDAIVIKAWTQARPEDDAEALFAQFPQWPASRDRRFVVLGESGYVGPSNAVAVEKVARLLHPEAF
jgi:iron complex transport system substrate-binding protein